MVCMRMTGSIIHQPGEPLSHPDGMPVSWLATSAGETRRWMASPETLRNAGRRPIEPGRIPVPLPGPHLLVYEIDGRRPSRAAPLGEYDVRRSRANSPHGPGRSEKRAACPEGAP